MPYNCIEIKGWDAIEAVIDAKINSFVEKYAKQPVLSANRFKIYKTLSDFEGFRVLYHDRDEDDYMLVYFKYADWDSTLRRINDVIKEQDWVDSVIKEVQTTNKKIEHDKHKSAGVIDRDCVYCDMIDETETEELLDGRL